MGLSSGNKSKYGGWSQAKIAEDKKKRKSRKKNKKARKQRRTNKK